MDYEKAIREYLGLRHEIAAAEDKFKELLKPKKTRMAELDSIITAAAQEEGLETVPAKAGTAYWSVHTRCTAKDKGAFEDFVKSQNRWDLADIRARKTNIAEYVSQTGEIPPGLDFSRIKVFNVRENHNADS